MGTTEFLIRNGIFHVLPINNFICLGNHIRIILKEIRQICHGWITCVRWFYTTPASPDEISQNRYEVCVSLMWVRGQKWKPKNVVIGLWLVNSLLYRSFYLNHKLFGGKIYFVSCIHTVLSTVLSLIRSQDVIEIQIKKVCEMQHRW